MIKGNLAIFVPHVGCPNLCSFCDQSVISGEKSVPTYDTVSNLCKESLEYLDDAARDCEIAFFGGSFTAIETEYMKSLLKAASFYVGEDGFGGIRISTRPDCIDNDILSLLKSYKVTSIELGVQSMDDDVLLKNRRGHTAQDVTKAVSLIREFDFRLGLQLMVGLYGSDYEKDMQTAKLVSMLKPDEARIYPVITLKNTYLAELYQSEDYTPYALEETVPLVADIMQLFMKDGIEILKVGLHSSSELEDSIVAGPYHQSFRELCESEIFYRNILKEISDINFDKKSFSVFVNPKDVSKAIGQKRNNIDRFKQNRILIKVREDKNVSPLSFRIETVEEG